MKMITTLFFAAILFASQIISAQDVRPQVLNSAQVSQLDVTGKWVGKRGQFSWDRRNIAQTFEYEFDLKQEGDRVTGTTTIINSDGNYADMRIEGVIIGNKLHFAEKEIKSAIRPEGMVWCFKSGELYFTKDGDKIRLLGATPSYMENSNYPCTGGVTDLVKTDNSNIDLSKLATPANNGGGSNPQIDISAFPNPFMDQANIRYNLVADSKVSIEVFDIAGKLVSRIFEGNQKAGNYSTLFNAKNNASLSGIFVIKMTVNGEVFSKQLVQMR